MINLYVIKDVKGDYNTMVFSFPNDETCKRSIPFIKESQELYKRYPEDFVMYRIGMLDHESGNITPEPVPVFIFDLTYGGNE